MSERAREVARKILGPCTCLDAFGGRGLVDPQCAWCGYGDDLAEAIDAETERCAKVIETHEIQYPKAGGAVAVPSKYSPDMTRMAYAAAIRGK